MSIDSTLQLGHLGVSSRAQEDGLELVHAGIGKKQRRIIVRDDRGRGDWPGPSANVGVCNHDKIKIKIKNFTTHHGVVVEP